MGQVHSQGLSNPLGFGMGLGSAVPVVTDNLLGAGSQPLQLTTGTVTPQKQQVFVDPLAVLDGVFVPFDSIQPGEPLVWWR